MIDELRSQGLLVETKKPVAIVYKGKQLAGRREIDILVERCVVVELKAVKCLHPVHSAQVITCLKLTGCPAGLLMNFNEILLRNGLRRLDHPDRYAKNKRETSS